MKIFLIAEMAYGQSARSFSHVFEKNWYVVTSYEIFKHYLPQSQRKGIFSKIAGWLNLLINTIRMNLFFPFWKIKSVQPDSILILKGTHIRARTISKLREKFPKAVLINCNLDHPFVDYNTSLSYISAIKYYDIHLTCKKYVIQTLESAGAKHVSYITCRHDEKLMPSHISIDSDDKTRYDCDILFIGTRDPKREMIIKSLVENYNVKIYWNNRDRCSDPHVKQRRQKKAIYWEKVVKAIKVAKINLNILRLQDKYSHNLKNMEIPWCGGLLLTERSPEIEELFENVPNVYMRKTQQELIEEVQTILANYPKELANYGAFEINKVFKPFLAELAMIQLNTDQE